MLDWPTWCLHTVQIIWRLIVGVKMGRELENSFPTFGLSKFCFRKVFILLPSVLQLPTELYCNWEPKVLIRTLYTLYFPLPFLHKSKVCLGLDVVLERQKTLIEFSRHSVQVAVLLYSILPSTRLIRNSSSHIPVLQRFGSIDGYELSASWWSMLRQCRT